MLTKKYRLTRNADVLKVLKGGKFVRGRLVSLKYLRHFETARRADEKSGGDQGDVSVKQRDFSRAASQGVRNDSMVSRVAVVVSIKIFRKAVDRNRTKRLVRESVRHLVEQIKSGYDLVFLVQSGIAEAKQPEVEREIESLLVKARLFEDGCG